MELGLNNIGAHSNQSRAIEPDPQMKKLLGTGFDNSLSASQNFVKAGLAARTDRNSAFHFIEATIHLDKLSVPEGKVLHVPDGIALYTTVDGGEVHFFHGDVKADGNSVVVSKRNGSASAISPDATVVQGCEFASVEKLVDGAKVIPFGHAAKYVEIFESELESSSVSTASEKKISIAWPNNTNSLHVTTNEVEVDGNDSPDLNDARTENYSDVGSDTLSEDSYTYSGVDSEGEVGFNSPDEKDVAVEPYEPSQSASLSSDSDVSNSGNSGGSGKSK